MQLFQSGLLWCGEIRYPRCIRHLPSQMSEFAGILKHLVFPVSLCAQDLGFFFLFLKITCLIIFHSVVGFMLPLSITNNDISVMNNYN